MSDVVSMLTVSSQLLLFPGINYFSMDWSFLCFTVYISIIQLQILSSYLNLLSVCSDIDVKESACNVRLRLNSLVRKIPWRREWQPMAVFLPWESHGQRSLVGYSPWGCKESDTHSDITYKYSYHVYYEPSTVKHTLHLLTHLCYNQEK